MPASRARSSTASAPDGGAARGGVVAILAGPMIATGHLTAFLLTVYLLILIPGPSGLFTVSRGVALGRRAALATVAGNTAGPAAQLVLVVVGLGAVLARSDAIYTTLKLIGAAY